MKYLELTFRPHDDGYEESTPKNRLLALREDIDRLEDRRSLLHYMQRFMHEEEHLNFGVIIWDFAQEDSWKERILALAAKNGVVLEAEEMVHQGKVDSIINGKIACLWSPESE